MEREGFSRATCAACFGRVFLARATAIAFVAQRESSSVSSSTETGTSKYCITSPPGLHRPERAHRRRVSKSARRSRPPSGKADRHRGLRRTDRRNRCPTPPNMRFEVMPPTASSCSSTNATKPSVTGMAGRFYAQQLLQPRLPFRADRFDLRRALPVERQHRVDELALARARARVPEVGVAERGDCHFENPWRLLEDDGAPPVRRRPAYAATFLRASRTPCRRS